MGLDVIGILSLLVAILSVGATMGGLALRGISNLKNDLTKRTDKLSDQIESVQKELRDELKGEIVGLRDELKAEIVGLRDRIEAVRSETVETRVDMSDRVARLEGSVFGMPLPDTGTDPA
ncbi:MAG: hypothetical protein F4Z72_14645 [Gemmatimonadales bacterium]|nr:hypothetical protein [Candidatus Palauibacter irciniicola]